MTKHEFRIVVDILDCHDRERARHILKDALDDRFDADSRRTRVYVSL